MKKFKGKKIEFAPQNNITEMAYQLIEHLFDLKGGVLITDESLLDDFCFDFSEKDFPSETEFRRSVFEQIESLYGISMEDYPQNKPLYVWQVADFVCKKLENKD